jgi:hypothetical protein
MERQNCVSDILGIDVASPIWSDWRWCEMVAGGDDAGSLSPSAVKPFLLKAGYKESLLRTNFEFGDKRTASLVAFAHSPPSTPAPPALRLSLAPSARQIW